jgi:hypothetical protein
MDEKPQSGILEGELETDFRRTALALYSTGQKKKFVASSEKGVRK